MRILRSVIGPETPFVAATHAEMLQSRGIGAELVGDDHRRHRTLALQQLADQPDGRSPVASALDQHIQDLAFVVAARQRYIRSQRIRTTISSRCHCAEVQSKSAAPFGRHNFASRISVASAIRRARPL
jgi:hypothetical protein